MELCGGTELVDGVVEETEGVAEGLREVIGGSDAGSRAWSPEPRVDLGAEESGAPADAGAGGAVSPADPLDQAMEAQAPQVVGHRAARVGGEITAEEGGDRPAELAGAAAGREVGEAAERLERGQDARGAEAPGRDPPAVLLARGRELREGLPAHRAGVAEALDREEPLVDLRSGGPQPGEGLERLAGLGVGRVVERGLGPERSLLLAVLLDVGVLVLDVQAGSDPGGDDPGPVAARAPACGGSPGWGTAG